LKKLDREIEEIFELWKSYRGQGYGKAKWRGVRGKPEGYMNTLLRKAIKEYSFEGLKGAIINYALVLLNPQFKWTYAWTLSEFLTRGRKGDSGFKQIMRFHPTGFDSDDYLTDAARTRLYDKARREAAASMKRSKLKSLKTVPEKPFKTTKERYAECSFVQLLDAWEESSFNRVLIRQHCSPEIVKKLQEKAKI